MSLLARKILMGVGYDIGDLCLIAGEFDDIVLSVDARAPGTLAVYQEFTDSTINQCEDIAIDKNNQVAYVTSRSAGQLVAISFKNPSSLVVVDSLAIDTAQSVAIDTVNEVAYVGSYSDDFTSVDISDPDSMAVLDTITDSPDLTRVTSIALDVTRGYAFTVSINTGDRLCAVDISDPSNMSKDYVVTSAFGRPESSVLDLTTDVLYVGDYDTGSIMAVDVSTVSAMAVIDTITDATYLEYVSDVVLDAPNALLYAVSRGGDSLYVVDISTPSAMTEEGRLTDTSNFGYATGVALDLVDEVAYICAGNSGTQKTSSVDISTPSTPTIIDTVSHSVTSGIVSAIQFYKGE